MCLNVLVIREIEEKDCDDLYELLKDLSSPVEDKNELRELINYYLNNSDHYLLGAYKDKLVATAMLLSFKDICGKGKRIGVIENVVTHHDYQNQNIMTALFNEIDNYAENIGIKYIILCSSLKRKKAHDFYSKMGYEEVKGFKKYIGG